MQQIAVAGRKVLILIITMFNSLHAAKRTAAVHDRTPEAVKAFIMPQWQLSDGTIMRSNVIQTERLALRQLGLNDADFILELLNDDAFLQFIGDKGVRTLDDACDYLRKGPLESYERRGFGLYAVCLRDGTRTGICGLVKRDGLEDVDIGFAFLSKYRAKGYAVESAAAILEHAKRVLGLRRVVAITSPQNAGSIAVLERIGLKFERMVRVAEHGPELKLFGPA